MILKLYAWLVFSHLFAYSFAYQGAIDSTKPQTFYPGAAAADSLGTQRVVTIPRTSSGGVANSPQNRQENYQPEMEIVYVGYAADGTPVLSIRPVQPVPSPKSDYLPSGRASSSSSGDDSVPSVKYPDVAILRAFLRLIRELQRHQQLQKSGKSRSSYRFLQSPYGPTTRY